MAGSSETTQRAAVAAELRKRSATTTVEGRQALDAAGKLDDFEVTAAMYSAASRVLARAMAEVRRLYPVVRRTPSASPSGADGTGTVTGLAAVRAKHAERGSARGA